MGVCFKTCFLLFFAFLLILNHLFNIISMNDNNGSAGAAGCALYVHFPFCRSRCLYCAFYSSVGKIDRQKAYVDALCRELLEHKVWIEEHAPLRTIYFGGGTPSAIDSELLGEFCSYIYKVTGSYMELQEFTMEVNPEDVTSSVALQWHNAGITRFSMGVQSMKSDELRAIGRRHSAEVVNNAAGILHPLGQLSLDLICGLPYQSVDSFMYSLDGVLRLRPDHLSVYMLEMEKESALARLVRNGRVSVPGEDVVEEMYRRMCKIVTDAGYMHYEISNFALPGKRSLHNSSYWDGTPYIGLGPSAASYPSVSCRSVNNADLDSYIREGAKRSVEYLSEIEMQEEYIFTRMRTSSGISKADFICRYGENAFNDLMQRAQEYIKGGYLCYNSDRLYLNGVDGYMISDAVMVALLPDRPQG